MKAFKKFMNFSLDQSDSIHFSPCPYITASSGFFLSFNHIISIFAYSVGIPPPGAAWPPFLLHTSGVSEDKAGYRNPAFLGHLFYFLFIFVSGFGMEGDWHGIRLWSEYVNGKRECICNAIETENAYESVCTCSA